MDATHFIADQFARTRNMLEFIALGKPVVTHLWLESCGEANCLISEKSYILRDAKKEKEIGFSMLVALLDCARVQDTDSCARFFLFLTSLSSFHLQHASAQSCVMLLWQGVQD